MLLCASAPLPVWKHRLCHESLGMKCPAEVYQPSPRPYVGTPEDLDYPGMDRRRVSGQGTIRWEAITFFVTGSLAGWSVGLKPLACGRFEVWFGRLLLGWIEPRTESFQRAEDRPLEAGQA